ncbi:aldose 1-epimerase, partial [Phenoliferia sp. Uapishka_3]
MFGRRGVGAEDFAATTVMSNRNGSNVDVFETLTITGFPGTVHIKVTYTLSNNSVWTTHISANAESPTPLLLSSHVYWNLDGYKDSQTILNHTLYLKSSSYIKGDGILIPTGEIVEIEEGAALDFKDSPVIGSRLNDTVGVCGTGCIGLDTCFIYDEGITTDDTAMILASAASGIKLSIKTNQPAGQVYTCSGQHGLIPRKVSQGGPSTSYDEYSCVVLEQEGWIDGINNPQWGQNQIYGTPGREHYNWWSEYSFTTF